MSGYENPLVLVTRPQDLSDAFVAALQAIKPDFKPLIAPAFEIEPVTAQSIAFDAAVFTSRAGVRFGPKSERRPAWCVGEATANAARDAGYQARHAEGNAAELCDLILSQRPSGRLVHFRGEVVSHNVASALSRGGLDCGESVVYRKAEKTVESVKREAIKVASTLIIPAFSAETVSIIERWGLDFSRAHIVAISPEVAETAKRLGPAQTTIADAPKLAEMTQATGGLIA